MSGYTGGYGSSYVHGSAARQLTAPERRQREYEQPQRHTKTIPKRRKKISILSILFTLSAIAASLYLCVSYVMVYSDITATSKEIASLEAQIADVKASNEVDYEEIDSTVDLSSIYKRATKDLGMVPASKDQIYTYDNRKSDRVVQYSDIPE